MKDGMGFLNVGCIHNEILFYRHKAATSVIYNNVEESIGYLTNLNKQGTEEKHHMTLSICGNFKSGE